jgi:hypothetical protein
MIHILIMLKKGFVRRETLLNCTGQVYRNNEKVLGNLSFGQSFPFPVPLRRRDSVPTVATE